ncbi:MAG: TIGR01457 family HAD-type hydrolase [Chloroflexi bacterium]|jgi:4-nitrophenyl phosphatase|nr:TIGR01457 family HAD-type hydrolase [Chloroflexota bacterium]
MTAQLSAIRNLLIDMDGVIYRGKMALPGAVDLFHFLQEHEMGYLLVTNNATRSPRQVADQLTSMGLDVPESRILTSATASAAYLATIAPAGAKVNVVGERGLVEAIEQRGFMLAGRDAEYVVAGLDKTITYEKLLTASLAIRDGATFIGTNPDKTYPMENDIAPGAGSILAAIEAATDVQPIVVGKPEPLVIEQSLQMLGAKAEETAMLGDRLETDILGGYRAGIATILVLTGISTAEEAAVYPAPPDWIFDDLPAMLRAWREALGER